MFRAFFYLQLGRLHFGKQDENLHPMIQSDVEGAFLKDLSLKVTTRTSLRVKDLHV